MLIARLSKFHLRFCVAAGLLTCGCADLTTYNHVRYDRPGIAQTTFVDAKQRAIFTTPHDNGRGGWDVRVCAEPSPDALSALAAAGNGSLSFAQKASLQAAASLSETASSISLRTQSVQLMRDAMFRICEGVASGTLSPTQFETLHRRFQNSMVAILAIEQLTGVVKPGGAQLSTTAGAGAAKEMAALAESTAKAQDVSGKADADATTAASALADATAKRDAYLKDKGVTPDAMSDAQKAEFAPLQQKFADATAANAAAVGGGQGEARDLCRRDAGRLWRRPCRHRHGGHRRRERWLARGE